jgi:hypothetical protein
MRALADESISIRGTIICRFWLLPLDPRLVTSLPTAFQQGKLVAVGRLVLLGAAKRAVAEFEIQVTF